MKRLSIALTMSSILALACGELDNERTYTRDSNPSPSSQSPDDDARVAPTIEISSSEIVVIGQTLEFFGEGFLGQSEGQSRLYFEGIFTDTLGRTTDVSLSVNPLYGGKEVGDDGRQILTWSRVGPYRNPFTRDGRNGLFQGTVQVLNSYTDGTEEQGASIPFRLEIAPSISIEAFEPIHADCGAPAVRILPGIPYVLRVRASGIKPTRFIYEFNNINGSEHVTTFDHSFNDGQVSQEDSVGASSEIVVFNPIADDLQSYVTGVRVIAYDDEGNFVETGLPIGVHRPVEVIYDGSYDLAERYEPIPVSGCIPGSIGNNVTYSESISETRMQSVTMTVSNTWSSTEGRDVTSTTSEGIAIGESSSRSLGTTNTERETLSEGFGESYNQSESNDVGFSSSNGESWSWNLSQGQSQEQYENQMNSMYGELSGSVAVGVGGEGSVPGFAKVSGSVETTVGVTGGTSTGTAGGNRQRTSTNRGYSMAGSSMQSQTFGNSINESQTSNINGTYALGRSQTSSENNTEGMNNTRTWNLSEGTSLSESATTGSAESISETFVTSETTTVSQGFSGFIPRGRFGIFYRQTTRWIRSAEVVSYDLCGISHHMGELQFNEWDWAPDLAIGDECNAVPPPSSMPSARCFIPPCGN